MVQEQSIVAYIAKHEGMPFVLGYNDCFRFALRWAAPNLLGQYRYSNTAQAWGIIKAAGFGKAWELFDLHFDRVAEPVDGCVVAVKSRDRLGGCGIWHNGVVYAMTPKGLGHAQVKPIHFWGV